MSTTPNTSRKSFRPPAEATDDDASLRRLLGEKEDTEVPTPIPPPVPAADTPSSGPVLGPQVLHAPSGHRPKVSLTVRASPEASEKMDKVAAALHWSKNKALGEIVDHYADVVYEILQREGPVGVLSLLTKIKQSE